MFNKKDNLKYRIKEGNIYARWFYNKFNNKLFSNAKKLLPLSSMKKLLAIALLFFYLPAISGVAISSHLCCGEVTSVKIQLETEDPGHNPVNSNNNCCNDIHQIFKIQAPQQVSVSNISCKAPVLSLPAFTNVVRLILFFNEESTSINSGFFHSHPPRTTQPLFVRNESFLI